MSKDEIILPPKGAVFELITQLEEYIPKKNQWVIFEIFGLLKSSIAVQKIFEKHFSRYGLSQGRFAVLITLMMKKEQRWTPLTLANHLEVTKGTMAGLLKGLESDGYIKRVKNAEDGRSHYIKFSPQGLVKFNRILPDHFSRIISYSSALKDLEIDKLNQTLNDLTQKLLLLVEDVK